MSDEEHLEAAIEQARIGREEGGIPIGAALVVDGRLLGVGRNRRVQMGSANPARRDRRARARRLSDRRDVPAGNYGYDALAL